MAASGRILVQAQQSTKPTTAITAKKALLRNEKDGLLSDPFTSNQEEGEDDFEEEEEEDEDEEAELQSSEEEPVQLGNKRGVKGAGLPAAAVNAAKKVSLPPILAPAPTNLKPSLPPIYPSSARPLLQQQQQQQQLIGRPLPVQPRLFPENALNYAGPQQSLSYSGIAAAGGLVTGAASNGLTSGSAAAKIDKGLRHFSAKVCAKVEERGCTSYNEVADDLVKEIGLEMGKCDHKNIRRRVYDALNVLMAIDIIRKDKKEIRWLGLPNETADDIRSLEAEKAAIQRRLADKSRNLREILRRCISLKNLIDRNTMLEKGQDGSDRTSDRLQLPFILVSAPRDCHVHCEMLEDRTQYFFEFDAPFQINEDLELLRLMGLDTARPEQVKAFFPKELISHVLLLSLSNAGVGFFSNNANSINHASGTVLGNNDAVSGGLVSQGGFYREDEEEEEVDEDENFSENEQDDDDDGEGGDDFLDEEDDDDGGGGSGSNTFLQRFTRHQQ